MEIQCVWEHNGDDTLLHAVSPVGAYTRGPNLEIALAKMEWEVISRLKWEGAPIPAAITIAVVQEKCSELNIADADSDVIFDAETLPLSMEEYLSLKSLALKSARDFLELYASIPDVDISAAAPARSTFYGNVPRTAREMYEHTKKVNSYYFSEIGVDADDSGTIYECRKRGFERMEKAGHFLGNPTVEGSYGEMWSLRKVLRRFLWHDRIHAKAMYRMTQKTFGKSECNPFMFTSSTSTAT